MNASSGCLFCRIVAGEVGSRIHHDDLVVAFADIHPQAPQHILVVPREHIASLSDLGPQHAPVAGRLLTTAAQLAAGKGLTDYRVVINCGAGAGQSVFHLHLHLLGGRPFHWPPG
jgi:histidine triad (HIT) family protein